MLEQLNINVSRWIENLEKKGRISFSLSQLEEESGVPWGYNCLASS